MPIAPEPGGSDLPAVLAAHARVLLPLLLPDGDLDWAPYTGDLAAGPRGLLQPTAPPLGVDAIRGADLILVPALAVDRRGFRLGRGGGSYDRALARLPQPAPLPTQSNKSDISPVGDLAGLLPHPLIVALLHDGELVDEVPAEPHDRAVHAVLTPGGGFTLNRPAEWTK